jgi:hypothetical protein
MKLQDEEIYHRDALARTYVDLLQTSYASSGVFLAAPRRTGKTTFIKEDLNPLLATEGALVIYVDLWEDKAVDPAKVVIEGIRKAILGLEGMVLKGAKASGLTRFKVVGFEMDLAAIGTPDGMTISAALQVLSKMARKPIFLVIDEAQHAQTTEAGRAMLFALKAARDALMLDRSLFGFRLLATGSNSDKLTALINSKDQAFYKAPLEQLEPLGDDYLAWLRKTRGRQPMPAKGVLKQGFERMGHRPEPLKGVLKDLLKRSPGAAQADIDAQFLSLVEASLEADRDLFLRSIEGRDPLDAAVLFRMAKVDKFAPFDEASMDSYRRARTARSPDDDTPISKSSVQSALERLRKDGLVWNHGRGAWVIEDSQHAAWLRSS